MEEKQSYWLTMPTELVESGDHLKALLYGLITSYADKSGDCFASNKTLAKKLGRKDSSIVSKKVQELQRDGYINVVVDKEKGNTRHISIAIGKLPYRSKEISNDPIGKKPKIVLKSSIISSTTREQLLKFLKTQGTIKSPEAFLKSIEKKYPNDDLKILLRTDFNDWTSVLDHRNK